MLYFVLTILLDSVILFFFLIRFRELLEELHFLLREVLDRRAEVYVFPYENFNAIFRLTDG